jgi:LPXTG-motif cell wall-anchored protein
MFKIGAAGQVKPPKRIALRPVDVLIAQECHTWRSSLANAGEESAVMPLTGQTTNSSFAAIGVLLFVFAISALLNRGAQ